MSFLTAGLPQLTQIRITLQKSIAAWLSSLRSLVAVDGRHERHRIEWQTHETKAMILAAFEDRAELREEREHRRTARQSEENVGRHRAPEDPAELVRPYVL